MITRTISYDVRECTL